MNRTEFIIHLIRNGESNVCKIYFWKCSYWSAIDLWRISVIIWKYPLPTSSCWFLIRNLNRYSFTFRLECWNTDWAKNSGEWKIFSITLENPNIELFQAFCARELTKRTEHVFIPIDHWNDCVCYRFWYRSGKIPKRNQKKTQQHKNEISFIFYSNITVTAAAQKQFFFIFAYLCSAVYVNETTKGRKQAFR